MSKSKPRPSSVSLSGIHLTEAAWLPPPSADGSWPGWLRAAPREFLVHPAARDALLALLTAGLSSAGLAADVHAPERTDAVVTRPARLAAQARRAASHVRREP